MDAGIIGAIIGGIFGIGGGIIGTYCSITNTRGPLERAFMVRASVVAWIAISVFILLVLLLPNPYRFWMWLPYGVLLPLGIMKINRGVARIRALENTAD